MDPLTTPTPRTVRMRMGFYVIAVAVVMFGISATASADPAIDFSTLPVKGMVTMIDLGAKKCIPCKMMAPILEKMEKRYEGRAAIVFIDVWEHRNQASRFGIRAIPTQIFYNAEGKEISRHVGFMSEADIVKTLGRLGVKP
jgi:thioredoxin 1